MKHDKQKAFELRREGNSYKAISRELGIPVGTLAGWLKKELWSEEIRDFLVQKQLSSSARHMESMRLANMQRFETQRKNYRDEAVREFNKLKKNPLFIGGLMLYWGKGDRNPKTPQIKLSNSDPALIKIFYLFLIRCLNIREISVRISLLLYPDLVESVQKKFWSVSLGMPVDKFSKSVVIKGKHSAARQAYGVCNMSVSSRALKERMLKWIELMGESLKSGHVALENY